MTPESGHVTDSNEAICSPDGAANQLMTTSEEPDITGEVAFSIDRLGESSVQNNELLGTYESKCVMQRLW